MNATAGDWQREPFGEVVPIPYRAEFSPEAYARLKAGVIPRAMEDKWFVYFEAPYLHFHRSWTGLPVYRVVLDTVGEGAIVADAHWSKALADAPDADPGYQARLLHFLVSNLLLGRSEPFPLPETAHAAPPGAYQHHIAGTGYPEMSGEAARTSASQAAIGATAPRWRDRLSTLVTIGITWIAGMTTFVASLWRRSPRR